MPSLAHRSDRNERVGLLAVCAVSSILLWQTTLGSFLLYPFTILATWFHEMGHGLAALLTGNSYEKLLIFPGRIRPRSVVAGSRRLLAYRRTYLSQRPAWARDRRIWAHPRLTSQRHDQVRSSLT